jgi:hypothetical protein
MRPVHATARRHAAALCLLCAAMLALSPPSRAADRSWNTGDGWFFDPAAWTPVGVPQSDDILRIGNLAAAAGALVTMGGEWGLIHDGLSLSNGVTLDTNGSELLSFDTVSISGNGTRLIARPAPYLNQSDFQGRVLLGQGAHFELRDNVSAIFYPVSTSLGTISGRGLVITGNGFDNNGILLPGANGGLTINLGQVVQDGNIDLDGSLGTGRLTLTTQFSQLRVNAGSLTDSFSGQVSMAPGALLHMNVIDGWTADASSQITVLGFSNAAASQIAGTHFSFGGSLDVGLAQGKLRVLAPMTVKSGAQITVGHSDQLVFEGSTTVQGGSFSLGQFGEMRFDGPTTLSGGSFGTHAGNYNDGTIAFNGPTTWNGSVQLQGAARQQGTATVGGGLGASIHADRFDMDGLSGKTTWNVHAPLFIQAQQLGTTASNRFAGTLNIPGGLAPRLTLQLADPEASWIMSGTLNLAGQTHLVETKVAGSRMVVEGRLELSGGRVRIDADTHFSAAGFAGPAQVTIGPADAQLWMNGQTLVDAGVVFDGQGMLRNAAAGSMRLAGGASLGSIGLVNAGQLQIGAAAGAASVHGFANLAGAAWSVDLGGHLAGTQHDLLIVSAGLAQLDGVLQVALIDLGAGVFQPQLGDQFTILSSLGGVSGTFVNSPVTTAGGWHYQWEVLYDPHDVRLQLAGIAPAVPEPGSWALMALGMAALCWRRRGSRRPGAVARAGDTGRDPDAWAARHAATGAAA